MWHIAPALEKSGKSGNDAYISGGRWGWVSYYLRHYDALRRKIDKWLTPTQDKEKRFEVKLWILCVIIFRSMSYNVLNKLKTLSGSQRSKNKSGFLEKVRSLVWNNCNDKKFWFSKARCFLRQNKRESAAHRCSLK